MGFKYVQQSPDFFAESAGNTWKLTPAEIRLN